MIFGENFRCSLITIGLKPILRRRGRRRSIQWRHWPRPASAKNVVVGSASKPGRRCRCRRRARRKLPTSSLASIHPMRWISWSPHKLAREGSCCWDLESSKLRSPDVWRRFRLHFPYFPVFYSTSLLPDIPCQIFFLPLIFAPTGSHNWCLVTRRAKTLITSNYYLPSTSKDQSTMSVELTDLLHKEVDVIFGAHKARSNWEITRTGLSSTG